MNAAARLYEEFQQRLRQLRQGLPAYRGDGLDGRMVGTRAHYGHKGQGMH
jgi:hypothetical protein